MLERRRWLLIGALWTGQAIVIVALFAAWITLAFAEEFWTVAPGELLQGWWHTLTDPAILIGGAIGAAAITAAQAVFLFPVRKTTPAKAGGMSVRAALTVGALGAGLLLTGAVYAVMELFGAWSAAEAWWSRRYPGVDFGWPVLTAPLAAWLLATPLVYAFAKSGSRETRLGRVASALFLGTWLEVLAIMPIDVMVRKRTDCYCGQGTFFALSFCGAVGLFALGPVIALPLIAKRRKRWREGRCEVCGYEMGALKDAARCPECGAGWRAAKVAEERAEGSAEATGV